MIALFISKPWHGRSGYQSHARLMIALDGKHSVDIEQIFIGG